MCGIVGKISSTPFTIQDVILSLKRLEYRGYDSVGIATMDGTVIKDIGQIDAFLTSLPHIETTCAISHTRWATHGKVTRENAHPHVSSTGLVTIVHNGILENYRSMRSSLAKKGYHFKSETDSEVVAAFFEDVISAGAGIHDAIRSFMSAAEGTFAILMMVRGDTSLYALKRDSPLVLGVMGDGYVVASDIYSFSDKSSQAIFFEDEEYAVITPEDCIFYNGKGIIRKDIVSVSWTEPPKQDDEYEHYMIREIHEQSYVAQRLIDSFETVQRDRMQQFVALAKSASRILFVAAGTSYHASLVGVYLLNGLGIEAHTLIASEFHNYVLADKDTLVVAISQSGETMDVVKAVKHAKAKGATVVSIVNVPYSSIQRLSDLSIEIMAGPEICVASTKTYTNQILVLLQLAKLLGLGTDLSPIPDAIRETICCSERKVMAMAPELREVRDIYVIGRGVSYPLSREVALKLKEIAYIHAEGMMGGELKHGTIALIEDGTIVMSFIQDHDLDMVSNTQEVVSRGARAIITSDDESIEPTFLIPLGPKGAFSILANIIGQLFAYYVAKEKGLPIDKPRNLAKSVTVK
jgi:glucosamine--fructose-6-phosphate aminotransferase (isomerizing)